MCNGGFLTDCVEAHVSQDRKAGKRTPLNKGKVDGSPVRLVTISGKGGYSEDPERRAQWARNDNISLLDHLLSVARGALMFCLADEPLPGPAPSERKRLYALVCNRLLARHR